MCYVLWYTVFVHSYVYMCVHVCKCRNVCEYLWKRGYWDFSVHISGLFTGWLYQSGVRSSTLTLSVCVYVFLWVVCVCVCSFTLRMSFGLCKELSGGDESTADSGRGLALTEETSMKTVYVYLRLFVCICVCVWCLALGMCHHETTTDFSIL